LKGDPSETGPVCGVGSVMVLGDSDQDNTTHKGQRLLQPPSGLWPL